MYMVRAIFFDFYSVWLPDTIANLLSEATAISPEVGAEMTKMVDHYYHGTVTIQQLADGASNGSSNVPT